MAKPGAEIPQTSVSYCLGGQGKLNGLAGVQAANKYVQLTSVVLS